MFLDVILDASESEVRLSPVGRLKGDLAACIHEAVITVSEDNSEHNNTF